MYMSYEEYLETLKYIHVHWCVMLVYFGRSSYKEGIQKAILHSFTARFFPPTSAGLVLECRYCISRKI